MRRFVGIFVVLIALVVGTADAQVPRTMSWQGVVTDDLGAPIADGPHVLEFRIYEDPVAGTLYWSESLNVTTESGVASVVLGKTTALPTPFDDPYWLTLTVDGGTELAPRIELTASPYTLNIADGTVVRSLNGLTEQVELIGSGGIDISVGAETITIDGTFGGADADWEVEGDDMFAIPTGNVGIGTNTPGVDLHIVGTAPNTGIVVQNDATNLDVDAGVIARNLEVGGVPFLQEVSFEATSANTDARFASTATTKVSAADLIIMRTDAGDAIFVHSGGVRINRILDVQSENLIDTIHFDADGSGGSIDLRDAAGNSTLQLEGDHLGSGESRVITDVLQITGGSDLSEGFDVGGAGTAIAPGTVVSIDPGRPGRLTVSTEPYDRRVAGIVSGAGGVRTGMLMGQEGTALDGEQPVALSGRVYCLADASVGHIRPGDLLTTSSTPGHARVVDDHARAQGATIGKAMSELLEGTGLVLVLVSLQ